MIKIFFKKLYYFIILLIIIVFCIFLLEFLLRIYGLGDPVIYKTDLSYGYAPLPNQSVLRLNKSKITINKKGLRATQEWDNQNSNKVLFFGDSVTYGGSYIDDKKIFSELTCSNLNQIEKKSIYVATQVLMLMERIILNTEFYMEIFKMKIGLF
jgi:hypothetical protein